MRKTIISSFLALLVTPGAVSAASLPLDQLVLPDGFSIEVYAEVENARQMARGGPGIIYVGSLRAGKVHAVLDTDGDYRADKVTVIAGGLKLPSGVAYRDGDLFVGAVDTIFRYPQIDKNIEKPPEPRVVIDTLPEELHHGWKFIDFSPDGHLYIPVGAPCNICLPEEPFATILRMDADSPGAGYEIYARGIRNSVGFDWHPVTGELWFTDNGRDLMGDDLPPGELNHAPQKGIHFGYPFFHGHGIPDPEFGEGHDAGNYREPALALTPHVAALGMMFYTGEMFPARYRNQILIPEHGSWNRSPEAGHTGYRITLARADDSGALHYEPFITGWLQNNVGWGRPVHIVQLDDGSILISDDHANVIYRVTYAN